MKRDACWCFLSNIQAESKQVVKIITDCILELVLVELIMKLLSNV